MDHSQNQVNKENEFVFPQLARFNALKVSAERVLQASVPDMVGSVTESITFRIEAAAKDASNNSDSQPARIAVEIKFDGKWSKKSTEEAVANFSGLYQGVFNFKNPLPPAVVEQFAAQRIYRDILISQIYPLAKSKMLDTLLGIGVNSKRNLGYDMHNNVPSEKIVQKSAPKTPRKKKA